MDTHTTISKKVHRRFILGKQGLWPGRRWAGKEGTAHALRAAEGVQIDPVSVIAQSHDLVLWGRVQDYRTQYLDSLLYTEREFFDYGGALFIYPIQELPYWRLRMEQRKLEKRWADFARENPDLIDEVRDELRARGPLRNRDLDGNSISHYRAGKDTGVALYYLWLTGELMSHHRQGKERLYDFLDNVAPPDLQGTATEREAIQFFTRKAISQLGFVTERDFRNILKGVLRSVNGATVSAKEARSALAEMVDTGQLTSVHLENHKSPLFLLAADKPLLEDLLAGQVPQAWQPLTTTTLQEVVFLSPLEYVSARGRAKDIFDFDYTWEIYKPAQKRKYGPYTLPVLYGDQLVARMDAKLDRQSETFIINGFWPEAGFDLDNNFAAAFAKGLHSLLEFLSVQNLDNAVLPASLL